MADQPPFQRVLVANRGEIAVRVMRGLRELGIESVAVHSDADAKCAHVLAADHVVALGGNTAAESYLDIDKVIAAAKSTGAQAIHPGYGFLSENPELAEKAAAHGITFIGPPAEVLSMAGNKVTAKEHAISAGVPVLRSTPASDDVEALAPMIFGHRLMVAPGAGLADEVVARCCKRPLEKLARSTLRR